MLNRSASLAMSTSGLKALPGKLDIKRHSPGILYLYRDLYVSMLSISGVSTVTFSTLVIAILTILQIGAHL